VDDGEVFEQLLDARSRGYTVRARFDGHWGYVERAFIETGDLDRDWDIEVRNFQSRPESAPATPARQ
jgi:hypothetical protein